MNNEQHATAHWSSFDTDRDTDKVSETGTVDPLPVLPSSPLLKRRNRQHRTTASTSSLQIPRVANGSNSTFVLHLPSSPQQQLDDATSLHSSTVSSSASFFSSPQPQIPTQQAHQKSSSSVNLAPDHALFQDPDTEGPNDLCSDNDLLDNNSGDNALRRRRHTSFNINTNTKTDTGKLTGLAPKSHSMASRGSISSIKENLAMPRSPTRSNSGSKRSLSMIQNRSSIIGIDQQQQPVSQSTAAGWISGISEVMANVSSRVVNTRAQEHHQQQYPLGNLSGPIMEQHSDGEQVMVDHTASDAPESPDLPPWVAPLQSPKAPTVGSEHGSNNNNSNRIERRSTSKMSTGSHGPGSNHDANRLSQPERQDSRGLLLQTSNSGSNLGNTSALQDKVTQDDDEESIFVPGGFAHRGTDSMKLEGRSLWIFGPNNRLRVWLATILMSKFTDPLILVIILTEWVFFVITPTTAEAKNVFGSCWTHYGILAINIIFTLEIIAKAIVYGLFFDKNGFQWRKHLPKSVRKAVGTIAPEHLSNSKGGPSLVLGHVNSRTSTNNEKNPSFSAPPPPATLPQEAGEAAPLITPDPDKTPVHAPFFRSSYNRLDGVVVCSYWIDFAFMMVGIRDVYIFKAISALRPLRLLSLTEGTSTIMSSLSTSAPLLLTILGFIFFFFMILSLIGLLVFQGALSRRCAVQDPDNPSRWEPVSPEAICGGYYSNNTIMGIIGYIGQGDGDDSSPRTSGLLCPEGQVCMQFPNYNPTRGLVSFDNIFFSLLTVFTISSMEGWTDVEYWVMDGDSKWAAVFFCVSIFLMSFLMIPLFIAGITYSFGAVRAEKRHSAFSSKPRKTRILLDTAEGWQFEDQVRQVRSTTRKYITRVVSDPWFPVAGAFLVFLNLVVMCFRRYDSTPLELYRLNRAEMGFTVLFLVEICFRIAGPSSWKSFMKSKSNVVDLILAIATTIMLIPVIRHWEWYRYLTVFQVSRAYRLIPAIPGVRDLMKSVIGSATGMLNLLLITFMFLLVCAPIPMMLFGGDMQSEEPQPINFDDLGQSFIALFVILTGENWVAVMYEGLDAHTARYKQIYGAIFFVVYYCASHYVLLNLFIAIVLEHFELDEDEKYKKQLEMYFERHQSKKKIAMGYFHYLNPYAYLPARPQTLSVVGLPLEQVGVIRKSVFRQFLEGDSAPETSSIKEQQPQLILWLKRTRDYWFPTQAQLDAAEAIKTPTKSEKVTSTTTNEIYGFGKTQDEIDASLERLDAGLEKITWDREKFQRNLSTDETAARDRSRQQQKKPAMEAFTDTREFLEAHPMYDRSLFIFPSNNRFRQWCRRVVGPRSGRQLVTMNKFNWFIFVLILLSIAVVIADDPVDRLRALKTGDHKKQEILSDIDHIITFIFLGEQALRILADGFLFTPTGYLRDPWNVLDFFIVVMSAIMTSAQLDHLYSVSRAVRVMSCLRVIRIVRYFEGMSAMFNAIAKALPRMVVALVLTALLFWPFAIYGVNIFAGYFYYCNDFTILRKNECVGEFVNEPIGDDNGDILIPRTWNNPYEYSFDTIQAAVLTLFEMASQEGWIAVLQSGRAVPYKLGEQPFIRPDEPNRFNSFYFLLFMLIGSIVFVQIFIGVILETFKTWNGISLLTVEQRRWNDLRRQLRLIKPTATPARPKNRFRALCYDMVIEKKGMLWRIMTVVLVLNVILIASQHYAQPQVLTDVQDVSYFIFLGLYSVEIFVKICGYGFHKWRLSRWNLYDFLITALALITLIPRFIGHELWTLRVEKFLLITISFRLAQRIDSLQVLFRALVIAMGSILNITAVLMVVFILYAVMFRELFGMTRLGPSTTGLANFSTFGNTMLMLIRMTTGENWDFVMHDMMVEPPYCTPIRNTYLDSDCGSKTWAYFMFLSFYIVCTYIILNMFIAVIISNFSFAYQQDSITTLITREDLRNFKLTWAKFDPRGTGYIEPKELSKFLRSINGRLCTRVYANSEYSVPNLVKAYAYPSGGATPAGAPAEVARRSSSAVGQDRDSHSTSISPSPSLNSASPGGSRSILGFSNRRMNRHSVNPSVSTIPSHQSSGLGGISGAGSPRAVPITISGPEENNGEKTEGASHLDTGCMDWQGLQQTLCKIDTREVARRRQNFNMVFKEAVATRTSRGISFYSILDILSFSLVDMNQALGMDEFLERNERVKEVRAAVARETIHNLLLTIIARRNFLKNRRSTKNTRLRPEVPRIVIDTSVGNERASREDTSPMLTSSPSGRSSFLPSPLLDFSKGHTMCLSDDEVSPLSYSTNTMLSINSNDPNGWDSYERDSFNRQSEPSHSDIFNESRIGSLSGFSVEGSTWFNMLQDEIRAQEEEDNRYQ